MFEGSRGVFKAKGDEQPLFVVMLCGEGPRQVEDPTDCDTQVKSVAALYLAGLRGGVRSAQKEA